MIPYNRTLFHFGKNYEEVNEVCGDMLKRGRVKIRKYVYPVPERYRKIKKKIRRTVKEMT